MIVTMGSIFFFELWIVSMSVTKTSMHQLLCFKSEFLNYFVFRLGRVFLFLLFFVQFKDEHSGRLVWL